MFRLTIVLAIIAVLSAVLGFGGIAAGAAAAAKIVFFIALAFLVVSLIFGGYKRI